MILMMHLFRLTNLIQLRQKSPYMWWDWLFRKTKSGKEHDRVLQTVHNFTKKVVDKRIRSVQRNTTMRKAAFLDTLLLAETEDGEKLSLKSIYDEVNTFLFAGHESTAAGMTWATYLIGKNYEVQDRIYDELDTIFGDDKDRSVTMEDTKRLEYLELVIKEAMRLLPPAPAFVRKVHENCEIDGYMIPQNSQVVIFPYFYHHSPEFWEDPELFNPDRFTLENSAGRHPYAYIPFSAGSRNCIGQKYAMLEMKILLSHLLRNFKVTSHDEIDDIIMSVDVVLSPARRLNITLEKR